MDRLLKPSKRVCKSNVKTKFDYVAILHHVFLTFKPNQPFIAGSRFTPALNQIIIGNDFRTDKAAFEIGMDFSRRLRRNLNLRNFYLSEKGITFYYNIYEIAPYVMGPVEITLPYEIMSHLLSDEKGVLIMNS